MHDGLAQWQVYFYRGNAWSNAQSSADVAAPAPAASAPVAARSQLPSGVRLVLGFEGGGLAGTLTRDLLLRAANAVTRTTLRASAAQPCCWPC